MQFSSGEAGGTLSLSQQRAPSAYRPGLRSAGSVPTNSMQSNLPSDLDWQDPAAARTSAPKSAVKGNAITATADKC